LSKFLTNIVLVLLKNLRTLRSIKIFENWTVRLDFLHHFVSFLYYTRIKPSLLWLSPFFKLSRSFLNLIKNDEIA